MAKLSDNQSAAVAALSRVHATGVDLVDKNAWKKEAEDGVSVSTAPLVRLGAVTVTKAQVGSRTVELFAVKRAEAEVGG